MKIIRTIAAMRAEVAEIRRRKERIGFVPTMGYFHEGHLTLMDVARQRSDCVVVSLFVNPTQFGPHEDLARYPRDFDRDEALSRSRHVDVLFYPNQAEMYPAPYFTYVSTERITTVLCGVTRPTHFRGVTTIVAKLFNIVQPDIAVFGQKDAQQAIVIRRMVADLNFPVEIIVVPTVRETDGLAMSSRNVYLTPEQRRQAPIIYQALCQARQAVQNGERDAGMIQTMIRTAITTSPLARIDYVEVVEPIGLASVDRIKPGTFAAVAVFYGKTRLIDNCILLTENDE